MLPSPETLQRIAVLREKARNGTLTQEECAEGIRFLRAERLAMPAAKSASRTKAPPPDANDLLADFGL